MSLENQGFDHAVEYIANIEQFQHDPTKYKFDIIISLAIQPKISVIEYWRNLISEHLADVITSKILSDLVNSEQEIVQQALPNLDRKLKLSSFLYKVQLKLAKQIRLKWKSHNLNLINILIEKEKIF